MHRPYASSAAAIEQRAARGGSLADIEREIVHRAPVDDECRSALWLYAWHHTARRPPRRAPRRLRTLERYGE